VSSNWNASKLPTQNGYVWATAKERAISEWVFSSKPPCVEVSRINGIARTTLGSVAGRALVGALPVVASEVNQVIFCSFPDTKQREHWGVDPKLASENHCKCVMCFILLPCFIICFLGIDVSWKFHHHSLMFDENCPKANLRDAALRLNDCSFIVSWLPWGRFYVSSRGPGPPTYRRDVGPMAMWRPCVSHWSQAAEWACHGG